MLDLQAREQARARSQRAKLAKQAIEDVKKLEISKKRFGSARLYEDFEKVSKLVGLERGRHDEANIDMAAKGMVAPSREVVPLPSLLQPSPSNRFR